MPFQIQPKHHSSMLKFWTQCEIATSGGGVGGYDNKKC